MKLRTLLGLTLVGTAIYAHKQNGGDLSFASVKKSMQDLWSLIQTKSRVAKDKIDDLAKDAKAQKPANGAANQRH